MPYDGCREQWANPPSPSGLLLADREAFFLLYAEPSVVPHSAPPIAPFVMEQVNEH